MMLYQKELTGVFIGAVYQRHWRVISLVTASKRGQLGLNYYKIQPPKSTETHPTDVLGSIEYFVNRWNSYHNN